MTELSSTCEAIMQTPSEERLVALLDQWSLQWTWRGRQRAIGAGAYERYCTLGLYAFGGNAPNVSKASSMKERSMHRSQPFHATSLSTWNLDFHRRLAKSSNRTTSRHAKHGRKTEPCYHSWNFQWR